MYKISCMAWHFVHMLLAKSPHKTIIVTFWEDKIEFVISVLYFIILYGNKGSSSGNSILSITSLIRLTSHIQHKIKYHIKTTHILQDIHQELALYSPNFRSAREVIWTIMCAQEYALKAPSIVKDIADACSEVSPHKKRNHLDLSKYMELIVCTWKHTI